MTTVPIRETTAEAGRNARGQFTSGPGNTGRPRGSVNRVRRETIHALGEMLPDALAVLRDQLGAGSIRAAAMVLDRFVAADALIELDTSDPNAVRATLADGVSASEMSKIGSAMKGLADADEVKRLMERLDTIETLLAARER